MNISVPQARLGIIACAVLTAIGFGLYKLLNMDLIMFLTFIPVAGIVFKSLFKRNQIRTTNVTLNAKIVNSMIEKMIIVRKEILKIVLSKPI